MSALICRGLGISTGSIYCRFVFQYFTSLLV